MPNEVFGVRYEVAEDEGFQDIIRRGAIEATPDEAHTVRVELEGLEPAHEYFYRFKFGPEVSPPGRTRTAPARDHKLERLTFAFVSCQNFPDGYFTPYQEVAESDEIHAVVHLGDYIYEGPSQTFRKHEPLREIFSLDDYRIRHGQYKTDVHLQAAHAAHPWLVTWDDHEFKNNYADLDLDPDVPPEVAIARRAAAYRAYWEHMPLRRSRKPDGPSFQLYRRFHWGDLVTFNVLDGRQYRSDQPAACTPAQRTPSGYCPSALEPGRTMLGTEQRDWLLEELATTTARWNVLAQQTAFAPFDNDPGRAARLRGGRQLGRLRRRAADVARLDGRQAHAEPDRDHRRLAQQLGAQRAARSHQLRRAARGHGVHGHVDLHGRRRGRVLPRTRPAEPAHPDAQQQPRLRALHADARHVDERVPEGRHGAPAHVPVHAPRDLRRGERAGRRAADRLAQPDRLRREVSLPTSAETSDWSSGSRVHSEANSAPKSSTMAAA